MHQKLNIRDEWLLTHRVDLHNTLRKLADTEPYGQNLNINLHSRVVWAVSFIASSRLPIVPCPLGVCIVNHVFDA